MEVYKTDPDMFVQKAHFLKTLAHPQRLCIVKTLCEKDNITVSDMQSCLGEAQPTVSQHLTKLKAANIIIGKRKGTNIYYSIYDENTKRILNTIIKEIFS